MHGCHQMEERHKVLRSTSASNSSISRPSDTATLSTQTVTIGAPRSLASESMCSSLLLELASAVSEVEQIRDMSMQAQHQGVWLESNLREQQLMEELQNAKANHRITINELVLVEEQLGMYKETLRDAEVALEACVKDHDEEREKESVMEEERQRCEAAALQAQTALREATELHKKETEHLLLLLDGRRQELVGLCLLVCLSPLISSQMLPLMLTRTELCLTGS